MAGIFEIAMIVYALGGAWSALVFTVAWRKEGCFFGREWLSLTIIVFILWPLILADDALQSIKNRERNRIARLRRRV